MTGNFEPLPIIVIQIDPESLGFIDYGSQVGGDLTIDTGDRTNEISQVDQGLRILNGSI